jgi:hypothetical protein
MVPDFMAPRSNLAVHFLEAEALAFVGCKAAG